MGLREKYKIVEFQQARQALDGYYESINTLALMMKGRAKQERIDEQVHAIREAKARLARAIERLGFTVEDTERPVVPTETNVSSCLSEMR